MKHTGHVLCLFVALVLPGVGNAQTTLRYTDHEPYGNMRTQIIKNTFFKAIERESRGSIKIDAHWNGEITSSYQALETLSQGERADIGIVVPEYTPDQLPRHQLFKSFPLGPDNGKAQVQFFHRVFRDYPQFAAELDNNNLVMLQFFLGYPAAFFTSKANVGPTQLAGTRWRTASFWHQSFLRNAGATTVTLPWNSKIVDALQEGQLDGLLVNLDSGDDIGAPRAAPYIQLSPALWLGHVYLLAMNKDAWNALSSQDQAAIQRAAASTEQALGAWLDTSLNHMARQLEQQGALVHFLSREELNQWRDATRYQQVQAKWVGEQERKGVTDAGSLVESVSSLLSDAMQK
ncbi:TRAP transporter substrate-binding protein DctP [Enterobacteriaceae bacterium H4N4]|uniref:TRAP transporter substrate-binding protein DctP n=1 Tax=Silvania confinis TaxID=2926470 RepID=A0A9J6QCD2_9ENTR|nr:TRAP transporter substrate-binding protein DctP [Silvania confinis]MCU6668625.1 TRAP transporter substrate-binding protein DctP [Silvania confinis]